MKKTGPIQVVTVEKLKDGVFVEFDDRKCAIYSVNFLHANLLHATRVRNLEPRSKRSRKRVNPRDFL